jgi:catechol 2,3-dioxygenase-like lactoylglutathione lyase family enzyme
VETKTERSSVVTEEASPARSSWTHLALHVRSIEDSVAFYEALTSLRVVERHSDADTTGMEVAWLGEPPEGEDRADFVLVLQAGTPRFPPARCRSRRLRP